MRIVSYILAMLLAITSASLPCLAKIPSANLVETAVATDADTCNGQCLKAISTRQTDPDHTGIAQDKDIGPVLLTRQVVQISYITPSKSFKPQGSTCSPPVDLFFLCRQLN